jgi:hypothetical protein
MANKHINDFKAVKNVTAKAILFNGYPAGRLIANWSDNPSGSVCSVAVIIWSGPLATIKNEKTGKSFSGINIGKAGGYGYDKLSSAVWECFNNVGLETKVCKPANGIVNEEFEKYGYVIFDVI